MKNFFPNQSLLPNNRFIYTHHNIQHSILLDKILNNEMKDTKFNSQKDTNIKIIQNMGERYEIELKIILKKSENDSFIELLNINIINSIDNQPKLIFQITKPNDPLFLYILELNELEYGKLKSEQKLSVDFKNFPIFVFNKLDSCKNDKNNTFSILFDISGNTGILTIENKNENENIKKNILKLEFQCANQITLSKYLSNILKENKDNYEILYQKYNNLIQKFEYLKNYYEKKELEYKNSMDNLLNEKNKEINLIKEKNLKETKLQLESFENEKKKIINDFEKKKFQLQNNLDDANNNKTQLEENKLKLEINQKDLERKFAESNTELNIYKKEINDLKKENSELNQKNLNNEKLLIEYNFKNESLLNQLKEKNKSYENMKLLIDTLNKQRDSNEDIIKSLKAYNNKLENKIQLSIKEISKANDIIQKLQNEIKNQKSNIKSLNNELNTQEQLTNQKQTMLDEQNKIIIDLRKQNEDKEQEIIELKNQIDDFKNKLNENEKLIEEDKQVILYLNKTINENTNNPFRARYNYSTMNPNLNYNLNSVGNFGLENNINDDINLKNINSNSLYDNNQFGKTIGSTKIISNKEEEDIINSNLNINNINNLNNNLYSSGNDKDDFFNMQTYVSYRQNGNNSQNTISSDKSGMIMPETNFTGYRIDNSIEDVNNNNIGFGRSNGGSLLSHKYGIDRNENSFKDNDYNIRERFNMNYSKNSGYNNTK